MLPCDTEDLTDEHGTRGKRKQSLHPCWSCGLHGVKCDQKKPVCGSCARARLECVWEDKQKRARVDGIDGTPGKASVPSRNIGTIGGRSGEWEDDAFRVRSTAELPEATPSLSFTDVTYSPGSTGSVDSLGNLTDILSVHGLGSCSEPRDSDIVSSVTKNAQNTSTAMRAAGLLFPSPNTFGAANSFMEVLQRGQYTQELQTVAPVNIPELAGLLPLWQAYVFHNGSNSDDDSSLSLTENESQRKAFYNSMCAMVSFGHASLYFSERVAASLSNKVYRMARNMSLQAIDKIEKYGDPLTAQLVASFAVMAKLSIFWNRRMDFQDVKCNDMFGRLQLEIMRQFGPILSTSPVPDVPTLMAISVALSAPDADCDVLMKVFSDLHEMRLRELVAEANDLTWDRLRARVTSAMFSTQFLIQRCLYERDQRGNDWRRIEFSSLPIMTQEMIYGLLDESECLVGQLLRVDRNDVPDFQYNSLWNSIESVVCYLDLYMGTTPRKKLVPRLRALVTYYLSETMWDHPFNNIMFVPLCFAISSAMVADETWLRKELVNVLNTRAEFNVFALSLKSYFLRYWNTESSFDLGLPFATLLAGLQK